ncbi:hypothetical protein HYH03_014868 [Edaphochlamys debaryana]|uniref:Uncharacterized protein n=1 Tax=Edaphochlamys debaryana TaxID=47281 RepID=A0A835XM73_9CHLO|nr:hypothetical protein HYH03_014868 [Edaphochlamys debaryana]|eukprot:KAG2486421.1 hypothetical protein HYH03_014868 [Edaphochlamys debaryana]
MAPPSPPRPRLRGRPGRLPRCPALPTSPPSRSGRLSTSSPASSASGSASALLPLLLPAALALAAALALGPGPSEGYFLAMQNISGEGVRYCGFQEIQRWKAWCVGNNITAWVASNETCNYYGVCIPLPGAESLSCANASYCSRRRWDLGDSGYTPVAACLLVWAATNDSIATCDIEVDGYNVNDSPPPGPGGYVAPPPYDSGEGDWPLWKTMTIIWSILGFFALVLVVFFVGRHCHRQRTERSRTTPVTFLTDVQKASAEAHAAAGAKAAAGVGLGAAMGGAGGPLPWTLPPSGPVDATAYFRPVAPDGKPILAYGSYYPAPGSYGAPAPLAASAGDALLAAGAGSRPTYNYAPMQAPTPQLPPPYGTHADPPQPVLAGGLSTPYANAAQAATAALAAGQPPMPAATAALAAAAAAPSGGSMTAAQSAATPPPPVVLPAMMVPPAASSLSNPAGAGQ